MAHPTHPTNQKKMLTQANLLAVEQHTAVLLLQQHMAENLQTLQETVIPNNTYAGEFRKYNAWVTAQAELQNEPLFLRENIDHYFTQVIAYKKGKPDTAHKVVSALQWYCNFCYNDTAFTV
jgi:predicted RNA-binding Zn ribbon-like protein